MIVYANYWAIRERPAFYDSFKIDKKVDGFGFLFFSTKEEYENWKQENPEGFKRIWNCSLCGQLMKDEIFPGNVCFDCFGE
jgi:hypothetical protein